MTMIQAGSSAQAAVEARLGRRFEALADAAMASTLNPLKRMARARAARACEEAKAAQTRITSRTGQSRAGATLAATRIDQPADCRAAAYLPIRSSAVWDLLFQKLARTSSSAPLRSAV